MFLSESTGTAHNIITVIILCFFENAKNGDWGVSQNKKIRKWDPTCHACKRQTSRKEKQPFSSNAVAFFTFCKHGKMIASCKKFNAALKKIAPLVEFILGRSPIPFVSKMPETSKRPFSEKSIREICTQTVSDPRSAGEFQWVHKSAI